jgi:hypothetical protein
MAVLLCQCPFGGLLAEIPKMGFCPAATSIRFADVVSYGGMLQDTSYYQTGGCVRWALFQYLHFSAGLRWAKALSLITSIDK